MSVGQAPATLRHLASSGESGRILLENEALQVAAALGIGVPRHIVVANGADLAGMAEVPGEKVVVKRLAHGLSHKTEAGAIRVVARDGVAAAIDQMRDDDDAGYLVEEYVAHHPMEELVLAARWTDEFGPVVSFGFGGTYIEMLAGLGAEGVVSLSPACSDRHRVAAVLRRSTAASLVTEGFRGSPPSARFDDVVDVVERLLRFAASTMPRDLAEFEVNPLVFTPGGAVALDAVIRVGPATAALPVLPRPAAKMGRLLEPGSIAVMGVSERMNPGRLILRNILSYGFPADRITVLKPGIDFIDGCRCVADLTSLTEPVDLLVLSVAAAQVPDVIEEVVGTRTAESIILIPGGVGEADGSEEVADRVRHSIDAARETEWGGPLVNGGNCLGIRSIAGSYNTFFIPDHKMSQGRGSAAPVAVVSQSGALTLSRLDRLPWLQSRYVVSLGNQLDLTAGDYMAHFAAAPDVEIAAFYVEGFRPGDGVRWLQAAAGMTERGGNVLLYRAGRSRMGAEAAASHTASMAGDYEVTRSLAQAAGVLVAETLADLEDLLSLLVLLREKRVDGLALGAVSNAGFECVAIADNLGSFTAPSFGSKAATRLAGILDEARVASIVGVHNPLDLTPIADDQAFTAAAEAVLQDEAVDVGIVGCVPYTAALQTLPPGGDHGEDQGSQEAIASRLVQLATATDKAWVVVIDGGATYDPMARLLIDAGVPVFRSADAAVRVFGQYCAWRLGGRTFG